MLELRGVSASYKAIRALTDVSIRVDQGQIVSLVGANGAGKSTLLNVISGVVPPSAGEILFEGKPILGLSPTEIVRRGIVQVPEGRQVFANLTVFENLEMGAYVRGSRAAEADLRGIFELFPRLEERRKQYAGFLSGGEQQMLALGRAVMAGPRLLLLDEPSMGLAPLVIADMFKLVKRLNESFGITVLLVEQNARAALNLSNRAYVLTTGEVSREGTGAELLQDPAVRGAFLGRAGRTESTNVIRL
jgi:branched-chain amino acid transport system ATP-binding protein